MKTGVASFYRYFPISQRGKNWGLYATTIGEARIPPYTPYPPSGHPKGYAFDWQHGRILHGFALVYISSGVGKFESKPDYFVSVALASAGRSIAARMAMMAITTSNSMSVKAPRRGFASRIDPLETRPVLLGVGFRDGPKSRPAVDEAIHCFGNCFVHG